MNPRLLSIAAAATLGGALLMAALAPDAGPPLASSPRPVVRPREGATPPSLPAPVRGTPPVAQLPTEELLEEEGEESPVAVASAEEPPRPPVDPDRIFSAELGGLASAIRSRSDRFRACSDAHPAPAGDPGYDGRLTVQVTLSAAGDRGVASAEVVNGPTDAAFEACVADVMSDARFRAPEHDLSVVWPVPVPDRSYGIQTP